MATAEFSLTRPRMFTSAIKTELIKAILDLKPQWAGMVSMASLISEMDWLILNLFMFFMIIPTSGYIIKVFSPSVKLSKALHLIILIIFHINQDQ